MGGRFRVEEQPALGVGLARRRGRLREGPAPATAQRHAAGDGDDPQGGRRLPEEAPRARRQLAVREPDVQHAVRNRDGTATQEQAHQGDGENQG